MDKLAVGPDQPTVTNELGGKQSATQYRFDLFDPLAMFAVAEVLHHGAEKYGEWNWRAISVEENLNHLLQHAFAYLAGDRQDPHLAHCFCRAMFALAVELQGGPKPRE